MLENECIHRKDQTNEHQERGDIQQE